MERKSNLAIGLRTRQDILKGKVIRKLEDGGDMFEDYWTDSDDESSTLSKMSYLSPKPTKELPVKSPNLFKTFDNKNCISTQTINHSQIKSKEVISDDTNIEDENVNANVETSTILSEDLTINLGVNDNNSETETLDNHSGNLVSNNLPTKFSEITSAVFQENKNFNNTSPSQTFNKKIYIRVSKTSKKSISRSTKKDVKIKELQSQFDKYDEKILQMMHMNDNENKSISIASEDMFLTQQRSPMGKRKTVIEKQVMKAFIDSDEKENVSDNESSTKSIERNTESLNQSMSDSESALSKNMNLNDPSEYKKGMSNNQENASIHSKSSGEQINASNNSPFKKNSSKTFISKKNLVAKHNHTLNTSVDSREDLSYSDANININKEQINKETDKSSESDDCLNTSVDSTSTINNKQENKKVSERNENEFADKHPSETVMLEKSSSSPVSSYSNSKKGTLPKKATTEVYVLNNENIDSISKSALGANPTFEGNTSKRHVTEEQMTSNKKSDFTLNENIDLPIPDNLSQLQNSKQQKLLVNKKKSIIPDGDLTDASMNSSEISARDVLEDNNKMITNKQKKNKNRKKATANKLNFIPDEDVETAVPDELSLLRSSKQQNKVVNKRNSVPEKNVSEIDTRKAAKKHRQIENKNSKKTAKNIKNHFISDEDFETATSDNLLQLQTSKRRKTLVNKETSYVLKRNVSEVNISKVKQIHREKLAEYKKSSFIPDENVEIADFDCLSQHERSERRKTSVSKRNSSVLDRNDIANTSTNSSENSDNDISEMNTEKAVKKQRIKKNKKSKEKMAANKKSNFLPNEDIVETDDPDNVSQLRLSKRKKKKSFVPEGNDLITSVNSSEKSVNDVSEFMTVKTKKKQRRNENDKGRRQHDEIDIEDHNLSKANVAKKSKSCSSKNNFKKIDLESDQANLVRRSTRQRCAPLALWRNERFLYRFVDGNIEKVGFDKGTKADTANLQAIDKRVLYRNMQKKKKILKPKKTKILDVAEDTEKCVHLYKKFPLVDWNSPVRCDTEENPQHSFLIKRMIETTKTCFGYLQIDAGKSKPPQFMPEEDLQLTVLQGNVEITIQNSVFILEKKDMCVVPRGSAYSVTNISNRKALLSFVVGKFKFLENV